MRQEYDFYDCVIIDSGVNLLHPEIIKESINGIHISHSISNGLTIDSTIQDRIGHGTAIYSIIKKCAPTN